MDLDAAKTRLKKARMTDARAAVSIHSDTDTHTQPQLHTDYIFSIGMMMINDDI